MSSISQNPTKSRFERAIEPPSDSNITNEVEDVDTTWTSDEKPKFRRAEQPASGIRREEAEAAIAPILADFADDVNIQVVQSVTDLPADLQHAIRTEGGENAPGVHWKGASYIIADNVRSEHGAVFSAAHELLHQGRERLVEQMAAMSGDVRKAMNKVENALDQVWAARQADIRRMVGKGGQYEGMFDLSKKAERRQAAEEWLAEHGIQDASKWYDRYVAAVRQFFRAIGEHLGVRMEFSDAEIRALIGRMIEANRKPLPEGGADAPIFTPEAAPQFQKMTPPRSPEENLAQGKDALERVVQDHTDVLGAMHRDDVGDISFYWGDAGRGKNFKGGHGIAKIIAKHGEDVVRKMPEVLAYGEAGAKYGSKGMERINVKHQGHTAVLSLYKDFGRETWLLTGWRDHSPGVSAEGNDSGGTTHVEPTHTRSDVGADEGLEENITPTHRDGKPLFRMPAPEEQSEALGFMRNIQKGLRSGSLKLPEREVSPMAMQRRLREIVGRSDEFDMQQFIWSGVNDWLTDRKTPVSKQDVLRYMADQTVRVQKDHILSLAFQIGRNLEGGASIGRKARDRVIGSKVALDAFLEENVPGASSAEKARVLRKIAANETESQREKAALRAMAKLVEGEKPKKHEPKPVPEKPRLADVPRDEQGNPIKRTPEELDASIESKIGAPEVPLSDRIKETYYTIRARGLDEVKQGTADMFHSLQLVDKAYEEANPEEFTSLTDVEKKAGSAYVNARMAQSQGDMLTAMILHGRPKWHEKGGAVVETKKEGILSIFEPISKAGGNQEVDQFLRWIVGERAAKLRSEGREALFDADEITRMQSYKTPEVAERWEEAHKKLESFRKDVVKYAMDAGIIDPESKSLLEDQFYVPFFRVMDGWETRAVRGAYRSLTGQKGLQRLRGSERNIIDPMESLMQNFTQLIEAANKNRAARIAVNRSVQLGLARPVKNQMTYREASANALERSLRKALGEEAPLLNMTAEEKSNLGAIFLPEPPKGDNVVSVMWDGKVQYYEIDDPLLYRSLTSINMQKGQELLNRLFIGRMARRAKNVLTQSITLDPTFRLRNAMRDTLHTTLVDPSKRGGIHAVKAMQGARRIMQKDEMYVQALAGGGLFMGGYDMASGANDAAKQIRRRLQEQGVDGNLILDTPQKIFRFYESLGSTSENMNRMAVYEKVLEETGSPLVAAYEARDLMDFSKRGDFLAMQVVTSTVPFLNARLQGMVRLKRSLEEPHMRRKLLTIGSGLAMASMFLFLHNDEEDWFEELPEWERDTFYHIKVGEKVLRIPKAFEVSAAFSTVPERLTEYFVDGVMGDDPNAGRRLKSQLWWNLQETFNLNPLQVQLVWPGIEAAFNMDTFRGGPIVSPYDRRLPEDQYDARTSDTMVAAGQALGVSPKKLEHLVDGYFGTMGSYLLGATDLLTERLMDRPEEPEKAFHETQLGRAMLVGDIYRGSAKDTPWSSRYVQELYDLFEEVDSVYASIQTYRRDGNMERARELINKHRAEIQQREALKGANNTIREINSQLKRIENNMDLSGEEKRKRMDELRRRKFDIARQSVQRARGLEAIKE